MKLTFYVPNLKLYTVIECVYLFSRAMKQRYETIRGNQLETNPKHNIPAFEVTNIEFIA